MTFSVLNTVILRLLRPLERQLVMNLLWLEGSIKLFLLTSWAKPEAEQCVRFLEIVLVLPFDDLVISRCWNAYNTVS